MKTILFIFCLFMSGQTFAGPKDHDSGLNLTEAQKQQMAEVKERSKQRMHEAKTEIHAQAKAEMAGFLSADQLATIEARMAHRQEHKKIRHEHKQMKRKMRQHKRLNNNQDN